MKKRHTRKAAVVVDGNSPRRAPFRCDVVASVESLDLDAWLDRYVRAIAAAQSSRTLAA